MARREPWAVPLALHEVIGPAEYEAIVAMTGGFPPSPSLHRHPAFGTELHAHGTAKDARTPHVHRPVVRWDTTPIPISVESGPDNA